MKMAKWIVGRLDVPNKLSQYTQEPLWYEVHMLAKDGDTVDECMQRVLEYWSGLPEMKTARLVHRPAQVTERTEFRFIV